MKKATFITNEEASKIIYHEGQKWGGVYYSRDEKLERGNGRILFRRDFTVPAGVHSAKIRATALGVFDLFVNGARVGNVTPDGIVYDELKPEWTDYRHRLMEYEYDLLPFCHTGENTLLVTLAPGWWAGRVSMGTYQSKVCAFCGEIEIEDGNGDIHLDATSADWQTAIGGRVRVAEIWDGEYIDACEPDPTGEPQKYTWSNAVPDTQFRGELIPKTATPLRVLYQYERKPMSALVYDGVEEDGTTYGHVHTVQMRTGAGCEAGKLLPGQHLVLDMEQNMVGRPAVVIKGAKRGTAVWISTAEFCNDSGEESRGNDGPRGSAYLKNYRSAMSKVAYIAAGDAQESFIPLDSYFGFRYLDVTVSDPLDIVSVSGEVVSSMMPETGAIETDNADVNRLISNITWGMRGNYFSNPTDCPQRDERLGWTGDTQIFAGAGAYLCKTRDFMRKWLGDIRACQLSTGGKVGDVIPYVSVVGTNNAAWGDAALVVPYKMWLMYHDEVMLADHFDAMDDYMTSLEENGLNGPGTAYGDWLNYEVTDKQYIATCYYAYDAQLMELFAQILMRSETKYQDKVVYYTCLRDRIVKHFRNTYIRDGELTQPTQTGYLLALAFDLVDGETAAHFREQLRKKIVENGYCLSTGFVGTGILNQTLSKLGMDDLAYDLLLQTKDPSWLYSVKQGATTVWERWNSYTLEKGFGDVCMNSFNHYAYGAVLEWMFAGMAGIKPDERAAGFTERFVLAPRPDFRTKEELPEGQTNIRRVQAHLDVKKGRIESGWTMDAEKRELTCRFVIPAGLTARISFPCPQETDMLEINGKAVTAEEICAAVEGKTWIFQLASGTYTVKNR